MCLADCVLTTNYIISFDFKRVFNFSNSLFLVNFIAEFLRLRLKIHHNQPLLAILKKATLFFLRRIHRCTLPSTSSTVVLTLFVLCLAFSRVQAQTTTSCFEITGILADACDLPEPDNEMVFFTIGPAPLNVSALTITWPNLPFQGFEQNATTAAIVAGFNASVANPTCGQIIEPIGGVLPANAKVVLVTGTQTNSSAYSFANLTGTLYMIFQTSSGNTAGYFKNWGNSSAGSPSNDFTPRTLTMDFGGGCTETVSYIPNDLVDINGNHSADNGALALFDQAGNVSYANYNCSIPPLVFSVSASPTTICPSATTTVTCAVASGYYVSGSWSGGSGTFSDPNSLVTTYTASASSTGTETLTFSINNGCTVVSQSVQITISASPAVTISGPTSTCTGSPITLTAAGANTYAWSTGATSASISVSASGTYTVTGTNGCGTASASQVVSAGASPTVLITPSGPTSFCAGGSVTLTASGADTYAWSTGATSASITVSSGASYTVTGTNACGTDNASQVVSLLPLPVAAINVTGSTSICPGASVTLTASGGTAYSWSNGANTASIVVNTPATYTATVSNSCGNDQANQVVVGVSTPTVSIAASGSTTLCPGASVTLTASGADTYSWSNGAITSAITVNAPATYSVTGTSTCGTGNASQTVSSAALPTVSIALSGSTTLCPGGSVTLTASGADTYSWSTGSTTDTIVVGSAGIYSVTGTNVCGNDLANQLIDLLNPVPVSIICSGSPSICPGSSVTLTASGTGTYVWSTGATSSDIVVSSPAVYAVTATTMCGTTNASLTIDTLSSAPVTIALTGNNPFCTGSSVTLTAAGGAPYTWSNGAITPSITVISGGTYTVTGNAPCGADDAQAVLIETPLPTVSIAPRDPVLCPGASLTLTATANPAVSWSTGASTSSIQISQQGVYIASAMNACGVAKDSVSVSTSTVQASFFENATSGDAPLTVEFTNDSRDATSYVWHMDDGTNLSTEDISYVFSQPGDYPVWLVARDANGCLDSLMHIIHVEAAGYLYMPTAFSPNGDGLNDDFRIIGNGIVFLEANIYSRWGNLIYTITDLHSGWDGTERLGAACPAGAYVYIIHAEFTDGHKQDLHGFINLVR